ncbi:uncharacterized protein LOC141641898 [Silene latifolia]|uniref:uncharacterized protein LOC141641898 n=1 Tax=Silene latifolia TaxID=37657 RepID=UPI003D77F270
MIDSSLLPVIPYGEDAAALWAELKDRFSVVDGALIHSIKTQLKNCIQTKGMDVTTYFGKLQSLWDALLIHEPIFACKCGACKCDIGKDAAQRLDNERLHQFFMGLDNTLYGNIRSQQLQLDPLPSLSRAYHVVLQEERLRREKERGERHQKLICSHCELRGHDVAGCFFKSQRFPEWWGDRPRTIAEYKQYRAARRSGSAPAGSGRGFSAAAGHDSMVHANNVTVGVSAHSLTSSDRLSGMCSCIIDTCASNHDRSLKRTIGVGELRDGLYWICVGAETLVNNVKADGSLDLWHQRLGHPSAKVVKAIPFARNFISNKEHVCEACHFAKQHRSSFDLNNKRASGLFDLVHCDLWGPYRIPSSCGAKWFRDRHFYSHSDIPFNGTEEVFDFFNTNDTAGPTAASDDPGPSTNGSDTGPSPEIVEPSGSSSADVSASDGVSGTVSETHDTNALGRGKRPKIPNSNLRDYVLATTQSPPSSLQSASSSGNSYSLAHYVNCHSFSPKHRAFIAAITSGVEPSSFKEAIRDANWCTAMKNEIDALERNGTWELTDLPSGKKALGCRWVYKIKYNSDGTIERLKARLVVFGNHQVEGIDYSETFAPVVKMVTVRTFLAVAAIQKWELHQMDKPPWLINKIKPFPYTFLTTIVRI